MQKDRKIVIRECDKGAGVIILNFQDYLKACYEHLTSELIPGQSYYSPVNMLEIEKTKTKINKLLEEGLNSELISKTEFDQMRPDEKGPGRFYCNFKVHKPHVFKTAPPVRPITSQSGSICEKIGTFVEHHIKHIGTTHESYLQDTPDFLRTIQEINRVHTLGPNTMLVSMDAIGLYTNIPHEEGLEEMEIGLNKRVKQEVPTDFLVKMMEIILKNNIFEFHEGYYKQNIGAAMGSKPIPHYANNFMAKLDRLIKNTKGAEALLLLKRFLDDYFLIFKGSTKQLHALFVEWNKLHPTIKLTMTHTTIENEPLEDKCECDETFEIPFLDVSCSIKEGKIQTDLYRKKTDRNTYLLPSSCHPKQIFKSIPFSLGLRIVRTCSNKEDRDKRLLELKH